MVRAALVVADSGLTVVGSRGNVSPPSPGLALLDGDGLLVGDDALRNARLKPRRIHNRFWQLLDTHPLARPFPRHLRSADLVHAHLCDIWRRIGRQPDEVILVVPGVYSADQLALLLGVAAAAEIPVRGMVDLAVAAAADRASRRRCLHLDLHLHRAVLTEIEHGSEVARGRVWENDGVGLSGLYDLWARTIASLFVRQTRFDPLHIAVSEQLLYLDLFRHIEALQDGETTRITIHSGGRQHAIDLERNDVVEATQRATNTISGWVRKCTDLDDTTLLLSDHMASVPGLLDHLRETAETDITVLHPASAGSTALAHAERIVTTADALPYVTRLPGYDARPPGPVTVPVTPPTGTGPAPVIPTHMVVDGVATAITDAPVALAIGGAAPADTDHSGVSQQSVVIRRIGATVVVEAPPGVKVMVNGHRTESSTAVAVGDRLDIGEPPREVLFVAMVP